MRAAPAVVGPPATTAHVATVAATAFERLFICASPSARESWLAAGGRSPGSRILPRAFPESGALQWHRAGGLAGHSGGTAPESHRTSLDHRPCLRAAAYRDASGMILSATIRPGRPRLALVQLAPAPPSSRGLGRRPLTAETGVRIPVAVLRAPAPRAGFSHSKGVEYTVGSKRWARPELKCYLGRSLRAGGARCVIEGSAQRPPPSAGPR